MSDRSRSASPVRDEPRQKKQKTGGFKWKDKKPKDDETSESRDGGRLDRGYRNRSPRRDSYRDHDRDKQRGERETRRDDDSYRPAARRGQDEDRNTLSVDSRPNHRDPENKASKPSIENPSKPKKSKVPTSSEPMIIVNINDRLGTKAAIPCFASDSIKGFKAIVAAHIGRQPHEIMLKRQGERPFKDQLTLQDYGVSNGVQLDLELDTGD